MIFKTPSEREIVHQWHHDGLIKDSDLEQAISETDSLPTSDQWYQFLTQLLLWLGLISLGAGIIFFLAFNWQEMSNFSKFALVQSSIVFTTLFYIRYQSDPNKSSALAVFLCLLIGALLALVGQTYQTGADPWQLFAVWAVFVAPFCAIQGASTLWLMLSLLINLSYVLYFNKFRGLFDVLIDDAFLLVQLLALNASLACVLSLGFYLKRHWARNLIASQVLFFIAGFLVSWLAIWSIFDFDELPWGFAVYVILIGLLYYWFRHKDPNLLMLAGIGISIIVVSTAWLMNMFIDAFDGGALLFISVYIISCSSFIGMWLKKLHAEWSGGVTDE